ncbi:MAG TPA: hypothetical protein VGQ26_02420 [Streptosporangiaceae bacterium]|jgi:hypothetical protein|nr:hypothetical protein [Streptosporangiaceae bacterium]
MSGFADRLARLMVSCYPRRWRRRYRDELLALLDEHQSGPRTVAKLASRWARSAPTWTLSRSKIGFGRLPAGLQGARRRAHIR